MHGSPCPLIICCCAQISSLLITPMWKINLHIRRVQPHYCWRQLQFCKYILLQIIIHLMLRNSGCSGCAPNILSAGFVGTLGVLDVQFYHSAPQFVLRCHNSRCNRKTLLNGFSYFAGCLEQVHFGGALGWKLSWAKLSSGLFWGRRFISTYSNIVSFFIQYWCKYAVLALDIHVRNSASAAGY